MAQEQTTQATNARDPNEDTTEDDTKDDDDTLLILSQLLDR